MSLSLQLPPSLVASSSSRWGSCSVYLCNLLNMAKGASRNMTHRISTLEDVLACMAPCIWPSKRPGQQLYSWIGTKSAGMKSDSFEHLPRTFTARHGKAVGSCKGRCLHAGVEAGPSAALLPALDGRHSLGLWDRVPEAAPGSAGHTGMRLHPCFKLATWLSRRSVTPLITMSHSHQQPMRLHPGSGQIESGICNGEHSGAGCIPDI